MKLRPRIRIFKKVRLAAGREQFVSLSRKTSTILSDPRAGCFAGRAAVMAPVPFNSRRDASGD